MLRQSTLKKYESIKSAAESMAEPTIAKLVKATGIPRSTIGRALVHYDLRFQRPQKRVLKREPAPYCPPTYQIELLDPLWRSAFCGFFMGEGSLEIATRRSHHAPRACINLREDDYPLLVDIQSKLGGTLHFYDRQKTRDLGRNDRDQWRWNLAGWYQVRALIETCLIDCPFSAKKMNDVRIVYECILARYEMPARLIAGEHAILEDYRKKLIATRKL